MYFPVVCCMKLLLHPLPVRICHWSMVISVTVLLVTGLYLNNPIYGFMGTPGMIRKIHSITGVVLIFVFFSQVYYYCYTGKFTEIVLLPRDIVFCRSFLRYYLFLTKQHPNFGRYNIGQKLIFSAWGAAVVVAGCTGVVLFCIWCLLRSRQNFRLCLLGLSRKIRRQRMGSKRLGWV
ncbi:MAG: prokaryotic cytochrome b561 [Firmicutes bacterium]|nr:prokaryotic cytochrome b561 [Bacillota bacterium]